MIQPTDWLGSTGVAGYFLELFSNQPFFFNFFFSVVQKLNIPSNDLWGSFGPYTVACTFVTVATDLLGVITVHFVIFDSKLSEKPFLFRMSVIFTWKNGFAVAGRWFWHRKRFVRNRRRRHRLRSADSATIRENDCDSGDSDVGSIDDEVRANPDIMFILKDLTIQYSWSWEPFRAGGLYSEAGNVLGPTHSPKPFDRACYGFLSRHFCCLSSRSRKTWSIRAICLGDGCFRRELSPGWPHINACLSRLADYDYSWRIPLELYQLSETSTDSSRQRTFDRSSNS